MLDVLTIVSSSTPPAYVSACRSSVKRAAAAAGYPVTIIEVPGVPGHIGRAMKRSLERSTAPYVAWVDDDDLVLPNAFAVLERHYTGKPTAIRAREVRVYPNGTIRLHEQPHHLTAFARDVVNTVPLEQFEAYSNVPLQRAAAAGAVDELSWVYLYRIYKSAGFALRAKSSPLEREELKRWVS